MEQRTQEWFDARKGKITASQAGAILGLSPFKTRAQALQDFVNGTSFAGNPATEYGTAMEATAREDYEMLTGIKVEPAGFYISQDYPWLGASPDDLIESDGLLEIKAPYGLRNDAIPVFKPLAEQPHYFAQVQVQLICTGRAWCDFYQWTPYDHALERVHRCPLWEINNIPRLLEFYNEAQAYSKKDAEHLAAKYRAAKGAMEWAQAMLDKVKAELIEAAHGESAIFDGVHVTKCQRKGSVSYAKAIKDNLPGLDLAPYTGPDSEYWLVK